MADDEQTPVNLSRSVDLLLRARAQFASPPLEDELFAPLTEVVSTLSEPFIEIGKAFRANIDGLLSTVSIPYRLAYTSSFNAHWQRIRLAEGIRSLKLTPEPDETDEALELRREEHALAIARPKMDSFVRSLEGQELLLADTVGFLESLRSDESLVEAANELILQGVVLCWGAFEVLARDSFIAHLNASPVRTLTLLADPVAKRRFELSKVSLETLAANGFNLSARMGNLLAEQQDLSDVLSIKAAYEALFPANFEVRDALNDPDLRILSLRRNLIVHRRGIIDATYAASANCAQQQGLRLKISPDDLDVHLRTVSLTAARILRAASRQTATT